MAEVIAKKRLISLSTTEPPTAITAKKGNDSFKELAAAIMAKREAGPKQARPLHATQDAMPAHRRH